MFTPEAKDRLKDTTSKILEEVTEEIEEKKGSETKSGRKSKDAKTAEESEIWAGILEPILSGLNAGVTRYAEELAHTPEEIKTISILSGKIAPKYLDIEMMKFKDEYMLLSYLIMIETQKVQNFLEAKEQRKKETEKEKERNESRSESKGDNNNSGKAGERENSLNKK